MAKPTFGNATITIQHSGGQTERIRVRAEVSPGGEILAGSCYTETEWENETAADWEYDPDQGLTFQGNPGGPYNFATYRIASDTVANLWVPADDS